MLPYPLDSVWVRPAMHAWLWNLWDRIRSSFWLVPGLLGAAAIAAGTLLPSINDWVSESGIELPGWVPTNTETARSTLAALAGAMIAVTGTVFSITMLTLSLASQQLGPRLLRRFTQDAATKVTLGVFLSTGFYCLFALRSIEGGNDASQAPYISVSIALFLAVISMITLIYFVQRVVTLIQAPQVVAAVAADLGEAINSLFPENLGAEAPGEAPEDGDNLAPANARPVLARAEGYIQSIDTAALLELTIKQRIAMRLRVRPGDFLQPDVPLGDYWPERESSDRPDEQELAERINALVIVGVRRTPRQDLECAIEELVEVAVRALSPGLNDPFTAINCIDRLGVGLSRLATRKIPSGRRYDEDGVLRVIARPFSFRGALDAAFNQIRQYGCGSVAVSVRILDALGTIAGFVRRSADIEAVRVHADMLIRGAGKSFDEPHDLESVSVRHRKVVETLKSRQGR